MNIAWQFLKPLVRHTLLSRETEWTVQGFGFLRAYFGSPDYPKEYRINVWDSSLTVPNVSTIHDHPWDFRSLIVAGEFENLRFNMVAEDDGTGMPPGKDVYAYTTIKTGEGGGMTKSPIRFARLAIKSIEKYRAGDTYHQMHDEIHKTRFGDGAVTINRRRRVGDGEHARVFWPVGTDWVDAMPRPATPAEVAMVTSRALENFQ